MSVERTMARLTADDARRKAELHLYVASALLARCGVRDLGVAAAVNFALSELARRRTFRAPAIPEGATYYNTTTDRTEPATYYDARPVSCASCRKRETCIVAGDDTTRCKQHEEARPDGQ